MGIEIERRFLVCRDVRRLCVSGQRIIQGYLHSDGAQSVRVRLVGERAILTMKGQRKGCSRVEEEWEIDPGLAARILANSCDDAIVEKTRYRHRHAGLWWEIDVFDGGNAGLIIAEVELSRDDQPVPLPDWVGPEVTADRRYGNSSLARHPFSRWAAAA